MIQVHDAGDRLGAVHGRNAARIDLDPLDHQRRDQVQVNGRAGGVAVHMPAAVHQHQRAVRAEAADIDAGFLDRGQGPPEAMFWALLALSRWPRLVPFVMSPRINRSRSRAGCSAVDAGDREGRVEGVAADARPGDHHFGNVGFFGGRRSWALVGAVAMLGAVTQVIAATDASNADRNIVELETVIRPPGQIFPYAHGVRDAPSVRRAIANKKPAFGA